MTSKSKIAINRDNNRRRLLLSLRSDNWLLSRLDLIWTKYFSDIPQTNKVFIKFGRNAKFRLGSIRLDKQIKASYITITSMFKDPKIPQEVIDHTIGHELVHYAHGFSSTHPRLHKYPHAGGVVRKEMKERGMEYFFNAYKIWMKEYRKQILANR
ncbi:MAG: hypothetical protein PHV63_03290 [Candidatus Daviesbacteria bacterium]|nr:hypothetical protein [Candidatus Daviesbacteria bacterium]